MRLLYYLKDKIKLLLDKHPIRVIQIVILFLPKPLNGKDSLFRGHTLNITITQVIAYNI